MDQSLSCKTLVPYVEFEDGTQGSILIIYGKDGLPSVFLINSEYRQSDKPTTNHRILFPYEYDLIVHYITGVEKFGYPHNEELRNIYAVYGVARLCTTFLGVHLCDMIRRNGIAIIPGLQTTKIEDLKECLAKAKAQYTNYKLEDELLFYASDYAWWERSILEQVMVRLSPPVDPNEWYNSALKATRTAYVGTIQKNSSLSFCVDFGYRLATAYTNDHDVKWWRVLEKAASMQHPEDGIEYHKLGFQEIVAFYGLAQYVAAEQPFDQLTLDVAFVPLQKRIDLYELYKKNIEKECLEELQNTDNPHLSQMPTKQDAQKVARERMIANYGRVPDWLPESSKDDYALYDDAFCNPTNNGTLKEKKKELHAKEKAGIQAVYESCICKHKADWGAVFKILVERDIYSGTAYLAGATFINKACGVKVTNKDALRQSPAINILGGSAESGWKNREPYNRESNGKLLLYREIAQIFLSAN